MRFIVLSLLLLVGSKTFALPPNPNQSGSLCIAGEFEIAGVDSTKAVYSFQITGDPGKKGLFYSEILNPDEMFNDGTKTAPVHTLFSRDSLPMNGVPGVKCPCDVFVSKDQRLVVQLEGPMSRIDYFGLQTKITKLVNCK